jgi:cytoskeletal protein CcmA (bactofilin family)
VTELRRDHFIDAGLHASNFIAFQFRAQRGGGFGFHSTCPDDQVLSKKAYTYSLLPRFRPPPRVIARWLFRGKSTRGLNEGGNMLTKQTQPEPVGSSPAQWSKSSAGPFNATASVSPNSPVTRSVAHLGATLKIEGEITSEEDLQIDGKVQGPISLQGRRLTVGRTAELNSEVTAREVIVYGKVTGNLRARDRVEIKKDGSVVGDITTARISIEDGGDFKGRIEIDRPKPQTDADSERVGIPVTAEII